MFNQRDMYVGKNDQDILAVHGAGSLMQRHERRTAQAGNYY